MKSHLILYCVFFANILGLAAQDPKGCSQGGIFIDDIRIEEKTTKTSELESLAKRIKSKLKESLVRNGECILERDRFRDLQKIKKQEELFKDSSDIKTLKEFGCTIVVYGEIYYHPYVDDHIIVDIGFTDINTFQLMKFGSEKLAVEANKSLDLDKITDLIELLESQTLQRRRAMYIVGSNSIGDCLIPNIIHDFLKQKEGIDTNSIKIQRISSINVEVEFKENNNSLLQFISILSKGSRDIEYNLLSNNEIDIAMSSLPISLSDVQTIELCSDEVKFLVNDKFEPSSLSYIEIQKIFNSRVSLWNEVNPSFPQENIFKCERNSDSGTRIFVEKYFKLNYQRRCQNPYVSYDKIIDAIKDNQFAIGYISNGYINSHKEKIIGTKIININLQGTDNLMRNFCLAKRTKLDEHEKENYLSDELFAFCNVKENVINSVLKCGFTPK